MDFWIKFKCKEYGFNPLALKNFHYVPDLPNDAKIAYENWFETYNFQNSEDENWIEFVNGTLNLFYHTTIDKVPLPDETWLVFMTKSEETAREICEQQIFHGSPNINSFWKLDTNIKAEEVGGRRNGYLFTTELEKVHPKDTKDFFWAVAFQATESVKLYYSDDKGNQKYKVISWAAHCNHMTLMQITPSGKFVVRPVFVKGKAGKEDRLIPQQDVPKKAYIGKALSTYFKQHDFTMFSVWDAIDDEMKDVKESMNQRKNALNTMNDEEVNVGRVIPDIEKFIEDGNVPKERRERNKEIRQRIREKNKFREKEIKKKIRDTKKELEKKATDDRRKLNPFIS